ncbi:MAG TPA: hypothetical protein PLD59_08280 [Tepidisphaeraceae bacterium]|nr:hypothetical protein [Tepidisphaeraceae bacterium]
MTRDDLVRLQRLIQAGEGRHPSQRQALFDIVCHVFLATEPYESIPDVSFFGISQYRPVTVGERAGLAFQGRLIGFPAYAALEEGDILLAVVERPDVDFLGVQPLETVRRGFKPGETIHLRILRDDKVLTIPLTLVASPTWSGRGIEQQSLREQQAAEHWERQFEPFFRDATD